MEMKHVDRWKLQSVTYANVAYSLSKTPIKKEKRGKKCETEVGTFRFISQILNPQAKGKGDEHFNLLDVTLSTVK
jgi:hypothetical protein